MAIWAAIDVGVTFIAVVLADGISVEGATRGVGGLCHDGCRAERPVEGVGRRSQSFEGQRRSHCVAL